MIKWNRFSLNQIKKKWEDFNFTRSYPYKSIKTKCCTHITCLEREALINNLLKRLDNVS
jgi:hypothetical protein